MLNRPRFFTRRLLLTLPLAGFLALSRADAAAIQYKDGEYTGGSTIEWGPIEVKAIIQGGKIIDVQFLKMPDDRPRSIEVTDFAKPILKTEAIAAQEARVNLVSSATVTSVGFRLALSEALAKAKK